jgi:sucrose phosphorylase
MKTYYASPIMSRIRERLARLYGPAAERLLSRVAMMIGRYGIEADARPAPQDCDQRASLLITYPDAMQVPNKPSLAILAKMLETHIGDAITHLHILPFFPASSDDGFSIIHFRSVDPAFGQWPDIQALGKGYSLVFDMVLNHASSQSGWFQDYIAGIAPGRNYFIEADPNSDFSHVVRPRSSPLLTPVMTSSGAKQIWTTFSADQVDLNYADQDVLFEMLDIMMFYIAMGARVLRLDAIAYLWKRDGTNCLNLPETHEIIRLLRDLLTLVAPDVRLLAETNLPHAENISYFGDGDEAHWIYQFSLPPLLLHALVNGTARYFVDWAQKLPAPPSGCAYLNITGTHDGIGIRPLEGLIPEQEIKELVDHVVRAGGRVSTRRTANGNEAPYELNSTWFDALGGLPGDNPALHMSRFLCAQTILMTFKGIPAIYLNTLIAASNDGVLAQQTGMNRSLNRTKWQRAAFNTLLSHSGSTAANAFSAQLRILKIRAEHHAFHPDGSQRVAAITESTLGIERQSPDGTERILALANLSSQPANLSRAGLQAHGWQNCAPLDILTGQDIVSQNGAISLGAYAAVWLILS